MIQLIVHKEILQEAVDKGVEIKISANVTKEIQDEIKSLAFCSLKQIKRPHSNFYSVDNKECFLVEPVPDDDNIAYGRDTGVFITKDSFTRFFDNFFDHSFKKAKNIF